MIQTPGYRAYPEENRGIWASLRFDPWLFLATIALLIAGLMAIYSSTVAKGGIEFKKQFMFMALGAAPFLLFWQVRTTGWQRVANLLWVLNVGLLLIVVLMGKDAKGAGRWLEFGPLQFQPSEMSKILTVVTLSSFYAARRAVIHKLSTFVLGFLHVVPSLILIFLQPHLGATIVVLVVFFAVSIMAGVPWRNLGLAVGVMCLLGVVAFKSNLLHGYQEQRVRSFGKRDERGANYQTQMAKYALANGGVYGTGYLKGEIKSRVPEQHNDFIFSVIGEEGGLVVSSMVLSAFGLLFYRMWWVAVQAADPFGRMAAGGALAILSFHMLVNLAMNLELIPVVGLWMPFLSYGGTAIWLCLGLMGLVQNIYRQDQQTMFAK